MIDLKNIGVLLKENNVQPYPLEQLTAMFKQAGAQLYLLNQSIPNQKLDLIIAMGGDGTVLKALDTIPETPVLAINFGTVGFLTAGDRSDLEKLVKRLLAGDYILSNRMMLRCDYKGKTFHAVNEVVLRSLSRMVQVEVLIDDTKIRTIRGDGVIVGTPTGSTGYLLSTGAPIVMPGVSGLIIDGLNEYNFSSRALIVQPECKIRLHIESLTEGQEAIVVIDGETQGNLAPGEDFALTRSERTAQLIFFEENAFFHNLASRLSWQ